MTRIAIIEVGRPEEAAVGRYGTYPQMIKAYFTSETEIEFTAFDGTETKPLPSPRDFDGWIIPGSKFAVYEDHPWLPPLRDFVQKTIAARIPMLGICFGHQLMAQAMGGVVEKSAKGKGIGIHHYSLTLEGEKLAPGKDGVNLIAAHEDQVVTPPPGATLLATSSFCNFAAFAYSDVGLSLQAHPEYSVGYERELIAGWNRRSPIEPKLIEMAMETLNDMPLDSKCLKPALGRFLTRQTTARLKQYALTP